MKDPEDSTRFPEKFPDVGLMTFEYVFDNRKEWVKFTIHGMTTCSGFFAVWRAYCVRKSK